MSGVGGVDGVGGVGASSSGTCPGIDGGGRVDLSNSDSARQRSPRVNLHKVCSKCSRPVPVNNKKRKLWHGQPGSKEGKCPRWVCRAHNNFNKKLDHQCCECHMEIKKNGCECKT